MFKKATGISFIDYLSRVRVEKSQTLLLNPNSCISEAAFANGFHSMTNFNLARSGESSVALPRNFVNCFRSCDARVETANSPARLRRNRRILTADDTDGTNEMNRRKPRKRRL